MVECSIVNTKKAIRFLGNQDREAEGRLRGLYDTLGDFGFNILFEDLELDLGKIIDLAEDRTKAID